MNWRNRWTFWALVIALLTLVSIPSVQLISALTDYANFVSGWEPRPLKPSQTTFTPRDKRGPDPLVPELVPLEFKYTSSKARAVEVIGDFNAWTPGLMKLSRRASSWRLVVPLRAGPHKYLFLVDGQPTVDPAAGTTVDLEGRRVSIRTVR